MPPTPSHNTAVVDQPWEAGPNEKRIAMPVSGGIGKRFYAWYDPNGADDNGDGFPDAKADWKFPHHEVDGDGNPGSANAQGCRNALARVGNANIPEADKNGVRRHVQGHLDKVQSDSSSSDGAPLAETWAILREYAPLIAAAKAGRLADVEQAETESRARRGRSAPPGVAVLPLKGMLRPAGGGLFELLFGGGGLPAFRDAFPAAVANDDVAGILIDVDSPGGSTDLIPETAAMVRDARGSKPIVAIANTIAASAAYWIAAQADELVVTPSGEVGAIGVFAMHEDISAALEREGVNVSLISAGRFKTEGNPFEPLSDEARTAIQSSVDDFYSMFVNDVAKARDVKASDVRGGYGEGRIVTARRAVDLGMANRVATFEDTAARLSNARRRGRIGSAGETAGNPAREGRALLLARERRL